MTGGPYLYDDDPEPLHTGAPRRRTGLLLGVFGGTAVLAVLMVVALPLVKGSAQDQAREAAGVFVAALQHGDTETAYQLLCDEERARLKPGDVAGAYLGSGSGRVVGSTEAEAGGATVQRVRIRWAEGPATDVDVVNESGPHVCGSTPAR
jgi:hypothetical protein